MSLSWRGGDKVIATWQGQGIDPIAVRSEVRAKMRKKTSRSKVQTIALVEDDRSVDPIAIATRVVMHRSDLELIRVLEDLIAVLCHKGVLKLDDLPLEARDKILQRQLLRSSDDGRSGQSR